MSEDVTSALPTPAEITLDEFTAGLDDFEAKSAAIRAGRAVGRARDRDKGDVRHDYVAEHLLEAGLVLDEGRDGALYVSCPWESEHTSSSGHTEAAWFPPGNGFEVGHYRCLHSHCEGRTDEDFIDHLGLRAADFDVLPDEAPAPAEDIYTLADLTAWGATSATPKAFVWGRQIPKREVTLLTGAAGSSKSTLALQLAICHAAGLPMLGLECATGPVLLASIEDEWRELHFRSDYIASAVGVDIADLAGKLHIASLRGRPDNHLAVFDREGRLRKTPAFEQLRATIAATGAELVIIDNLGHVFIGNENDRGQATGFLNLLYGLCTEYGTTVVLIAHPNKQGATYSGSTAWVAAVRSQLVLEHPEGSADPDERVLRIEKANYSRADEEIRFRWFNHALVLDADLPTDVRAELAANAAVAGDNAIFLACLEARTRDGLVVSPNVSPSYAPSQFEAMPAARGIGRDRLRAALERLLALGIVEVFDHENKGKGRTIKALRAAARTSPNASRTDSPDVPEQSSRTSPHTYPIPKGIEGVAPRASPPSTDNDTGDER